MARKPERTGRTEAPKKVKSLGKGADNSPSVLIGPDEMALVRRLIRLVQRTGIGELEVSSGGRTVRISAAGAPAGFVPRMAVAPAPLEAPPAAPKAEPPAAAKSLAITSPMVGTFYRAPAPDADPYVEAGDVVEVGQTVCIVEAMKLMNEIESEVRGRIVKALVENAQPVEFGQQLFLVEPV